MTRIEKLLAVANDPNATPEERAAYRAKAEELAAVNPAKPRTMADDVLRSFRGTGWKVEMTYGTACTFSSYGAWNVVAT